MTNTRNVAEEADRTGHHAGHDIGRDAGWRDDEAGPAWEEQGPAWVSYAGLQARLYHLGWLGEELTGALDRREGGMRVEGLLSVITAECAAVARTALALAADPGPHNDQDPDDQDPDDQDPDDQDPDDEADSGGWPAGRGAGRGAGRPVGGGAS